MMKCGIQYQTEFNDADIQKNVYDNGFVRLELPYEEIQEYEDLYLSLSETEKNAVPKVAGIAVKAEELNIDLFFDAVMKAKAWECQYLLVDTGHVSDAENLSEIVEECGDFLCESGVEIYLENGYREGEKGEFLCSRFSDMSELKKLAAGYNRICDRECFGVSINVGYANLAVKNLRAMVEEAGKMLKLIHVNDNDGLKDQRQLPLTFTKGRGTRITDWYRLVGTLMRSGYQGFCIWNTTGLFEKAPACLYPAFLALMKSLMEEWEEQYLLEERLDQKGKKLILFGTGAMAYNFMCEWSHKYPPAFFVDNNSGIWNKERFGVVVKSPKSILEIPAEERNVWICNRFYDAIGAQLTAMGVEYHCYNDNYYM